MPSSARLPGGPFRARDAVVAGTVTRRQLDGPRFQRLYRGIYVPVGASVDHLTRCGAAALLLPPGGAISHRSAAYLYGADILDRDPPVEVTSRRLRPQQGLLVCRAALPGTEVRTRRGLPVTSPCRTTVDLACDADVVRAVIGVDAMLATRMVQLPALRDHLTTCCVGRRGLPHARRALALAAEGVESPMETRTRLVLVLGGLPTPIVQHTVRDPLGHFVARVDLAYPDLRLAIEYDGDHHRDRKTFRRDVRRLNALRLAGWTVLRFTADDILRTPARTLAQVRAAMEAA